MLTLVLAASGTALATGLEQAGGRSVYSVEIDRHAQATYPANFGPIDEPDVRGVDPLTLPAYDVLAAGFPCQPFSIAGVSKKASLGRAHGFADEASGNLFFDVRTAVLMLEHGVRRIYTVDADFLQFPDLEVVNPLRPNAN